MRAIALAIACDIHPLNNLRVLRYLTGALGVSDAQKDGWYRTGATPVSRRSRRGWPPTRRPDAFCHGDAPTLADVFLVPQMANARRMAVDLAGFPTLVRIDAACQALPAFADAAPARQPDAEP